MAEEEAVCNQGAIVDVAGMLDPGGADTDRTHRLADEAATGRRVVEATARRSIGEATAPLRAATEDQACAVGGHRLPRRAIKAAMIAHMTGDPPLGAHTAQGPVPTALDKHPPVRRQHRATGIHHREGTTLILRK